MMRWIDSRSKSARHLVVVRRCGTLKSHYYKSSDQINGISAWPELKRSELFAIVSFSPRSDLQSARISKVRNCTVLGQCKLFIFHVAYMWQHKTHAQTKVTSDGNDDTTKFILCVHVFFFSSAHIRIFTAPMCVRKWQYKARTIYYISVAHISPSFLFILSLNSWMRTGELKIARKILFSIEISDWNWVWDMASSSKNDAWKTWEKSGRSDL